MYYCFMWLDRFRNKYWFNFLSISGWIYFVLFLVFTCPQIFIVNVLGETDHFFGIGVTYLLILALSLVILFISGLILVIEKITSIKINNKDLQNKTFKNLQSVGFIFAFLPIIIAIFILINICFSFNFPF